MKIDIVEDPQSFAQIRQEWTDLCLRSSPHQYFQTFDWHWTWWTHVGSPKGDKLRIIIVRESGCVVSIWPLVIARQSSCRVLKWMADDVSDYCDVLIDRETEARECLKKAWDVLRSISGADVLKLDHVRADSPIRSLLEKEICETPSISVAPFIELERWKNWPTYYAAFKKNLQVKTHSRKLRRLKEKGPVSFTIVNNEKNLDNIVQLMIRQKIGRFEEKGQSGVWDKGSHVAFLLSAVKNAFADNTLHLSVLSVNDHAIAIHLGWRYNNCLYYYIPTFDLSFRQFSPGRILLENLLEWCFTNNVKMFDFMLGDETYKYNWTNSEMQSYSYASPITLWGRVYFKWVTGSLKLFLKSIFDRMPSVLRRRMGILLKK